MWSTTLVLNGSMWVRNGVSMFSSIGPNAIGGGDRCHAFPGCWTAPVLSPPVTAVTLGNTAASRRAPRGRASAAGTLPACAGGMNTDRPSATAALATAFAGLLLASALLLVDVHLMN